MSHDPDKLKAAIAWSYGFDEGWLGGDATPAPYADAPELQKEFMEGYACGRAYMLKECPARAGEKQHE